MSTHHVGKFNGTLIPNLPNFLFFYFFLNFCAFKFTQLKNAPTPPPPKKNYLSSHSTHKWNLEMKFLGFKFDISKAIFLLSILILIIRTCFGLVLTNPHQNWQLFAN
jgi:hypothetical protein